jgi:hypothetical protein
VVATAADQRSSSSRSLAAMPAAGNKRLASRVSEIRRSAAVIPRSLADSNGMASWRGAADRSTDGGGVFMSLLLDDCRTVRRASSETMLDQRLDQVLGLPAPTIELLVECFRQARQIGDDEAAVSSLGAGLDAGDDAALDGPAFRGIAEVAVATDLVALAGKAAQGGILGERGDVAEQHRVAGQPKDVADALALAPCHRFGPAVMAVAAHDDLDRRPAGADAADNMAQHQRHLGPVRCLAGTQDDGDGFAGRRLVDVDRQKAAAVIVGVPQCQLLAAVHAVLGVVDSLPLRRQGSSRMRRGA